MLEYCYSCYLIQNSARRVGLLGNEVSDMGLIECYINGDFCKFKIEPGWSTLYFIREILHLNGTKESCSEGDCGACTVVIGQWENDKFVYNSVNSCIFPIAKLNNCHLITIEGIADNDKLHPIQQFLLDHHGAQCGFCTPGIVLSLFSLFSKGMCQSRESIFAFLEGNLCRCTGYLAILDAAEAVSTYYQKNPELYESFYPEHFQDIQLSLKDYKNKELNFFSTKAVETYDTVSYFIPVLKSSVFTLLKKFPDAKIINGGTDLWVDINIHRNIPQTIIDISKISELSQIIEDERNIIVGSTVTYQMVCDNETIKKHFPILSNIISKIASQQIRHTATLAGNIANASPVADMATVLLGLGASIVIMNEDHESSVLIKDFYLDYKKTILNQGDIIKQIIIPKQNCFFNFEKSTKRIAVDISAVVSFINVEIYQGCIKNITLSFGGVSAFPKLAYSDLSDLDLINKRSDFEGFINHIQEQFNPISDVRGSREYRLLLIRNHCLAHLEKLQLFIGGSCD